MVNAPSPSRDEWDVMRDDVRKNRKREFLVEYCGMPAKLPDAEVEKWAANRQVEIDADRDDWKKKVEEFEKRYEVEWHKKLVDAGFSEDEVKNLTFIPVNDPRYADYTRIMDERKDVREFLLKSLLSCDRVEIKASELTESNGQASPIATTLPIVPNGTVTLSAEEANRWLKVTEAATICAINAGVITRAIDEGKLKSNGEKSRKRRVDSMDLARWQLERAKRPEPQESDAAVMKRLRSNEH